MKKLNVFKWTGLGLLAVVLAVVSVFVFLNKNSSSRIVLADEAKEHKIKLHNAVGEHACDCFQPQISNVKIANITATTADISWHCGAEWGAGGASYQVKWGTTTNKTNTYPKDKPTVQYVDHTITLPNLTPNTEYHVGVLSYCLNDCARGGGPNMAKTFQQNPRQDDWTFKTTKAADMYTISGTVTTGTPTPTPVSGVLVTLSGGASKKVTTGSDGAYKFDSLVLGTYTVTPTKALTTFSPPSKTFTALGANQTQVYAVATGVLNPVAERAVMSEVKVAEVTAKNVTITWNTNLPATAMVEYGLTAEYGMKSGVNTEMVYDHDIQLFQLQKGATYHARAVSYVGDNSNATSYSSDFTFKVPSVEDRIIDKKSIINEPNPATSWTMFNYFLHQPAKSVNIEILTLSGKHVATLESPSSSLHEGWNKVRWDDIKLKNGLYVYKMKVQTTTNMVEEIQCSSLRIAR
jgi:hypothetical protein